ncbi:lysylphosphatidylglycerol synthase transmembrane domain-containing protein [Ammonicoccus fulvus]|uniref:Lysylphosphatidylglycerol synthase transmembrane domain-containing protein n=1 Tax=Ammonicoccus fulvus TaxID=3138240 RepID=A0ABZ3FUZ2_9ACTN
MRPAIGAALLVAVVVMLGPETVLTGVRSLDAPTLLIGAALAAWSTAFASWRWVTIARACGLSLNFRDALVSYYRSQLLNSTLPGGVLGDVDRAAWQARHQRDIPRGAGAVAVERTVGQTVLLLGAAVVMVLWGSGAGFSPAVLTGLAVACVAFAGLTVVVGWRTQVLARGRTSIGFFVRIVTASALAIMGYVGTFLLAAHAVGVTAPATELLPLAVLVIAGSAIPVNFAGWGPREGVAAWAFATAGLGAELGLSVSVAYGLISLVAVLPGLIPIALGRRPVEHPMDTKEIPMA